MATLTNTCEGTSGTAVSTTNSAGPQQFDAVTISGTGTTLTWDNTRAHGGATSMKLLMAAVASTAYATWSTQITSTANAYQRLYLYLTANPTANTRVTALLSGASLAASLQLTTGGLLRTVNSAGAVLATMTPTVPLNQWVRVEFEVTGISGSTGTVNARMYSGTNLEGGTPDTNGSLTSAAAAVTGAVTQCWLGASSSATMTTAWSAWLDDVAFSDTAQPGPVSAAIPRIPRRSPVPMMRAANF